MGRVFISYASEDRPAAERALRALSEDGHEAWIAEREVSAGASFVRAIEEALERADHVLVLWSHHASNSAWVATERHAAIAAQHDGRSLRVVMGCLDDTPVPLLSRAHVNVPLRDGAGWARLRDAVDGVASPGKFLERLAGAEIAREHELQAVERRLQRGEHAVVLAPAGGGARTFMHQVRTHLMRRWPQWRVELVSALPLNQRERADRGSYETRLSELLLGPDGLDAGRGKLVVILHGWSRTPPGHRETLGDLLRACIEERKHRFGFVGVGAYELFQLRMSGTLSALNTADRIYLPAFTQEEVRTWLAAAGDVAAPEHAATLIRLTGGHPASLARLVVRWGDGENWQGLEALVDDEIQDAVQQVLGAPGERKRVYESLRELCAAQDGLTEPLEPDHILHLMFFRALCSLSSRRYRVRCRAVVRVLEGWKGG